jgi:UDP-N-acetylmuramate dehydrogenase
MRIQHHVSLRPYNTFHMDVPAEMLAEVTNAGQLEEVPLTATRHILGGGSNVLLTGPVAGLVLLNRLRGIRFVKMNGMYGWRCRREKYGMSLYCMPLHTTWLGWKTLP